jgi:hypothetical protein
MTDPNPADLEPVSDDDVAFSVRMASKTSIKRSRGKTPIAESEAAETMAARSLVEKLKRARLLFFRRRSPGPPPSGAHMGSGPGSVGKHRP